MNSLAAPATSRAQNQNTLQSPRPLALWLALVCALIVAMVVVGGITRLTGSGLSIVDWKPILGVIPPLDSQAWQEAFERYRQFPQYKLLNQGMTLGQFKFIYFWEYLHRLLGRLIGVVFLIPFLFFVIRRQISRALASRLAVGFLLGGLQGALGWFMVKSGLVDRPHVSHYRLAAHLCLALLVFTYLFWILLDLLPPKERFLGIPSQLSRLRRFMLWITAVIFVQIIYGAFTAGLKAGFAFSTFPMMDGQWIPAGILYMKPSWLNFLENPITVQFLHRCIAWTLLLLVLSFYWWSRRLKLTSRMKASIRALNLMILIQFLLGVSTLVFHVPLAIATLHQFGACVLLTCAVWVNHNLKKTPCCQAAEGGQEEPKALLFTAHQDDRKSLEREWRANREFLP